MLQFQSTPSGGKATTQESTYASTPAVSIHAFRGEGDLSASLYRLKIRCFNPRLPGGRRHRFRQGSIMSTPVSIHAFRGEGDYGQLGSGAILGRFNPRLPGGRRLRATRIRRHTGTFQSTPSGGKATQAIEIVVSHAPFQSTPSGGKATFSPGYCVKFLRVSIHAFRGEGDTRLLS